MSWNKGERYLIELKNGSKYKGTFQHSTRDASGYNYHFDNVEGVTNGMKFGSWSFGQNNITSATPLQVLTPSSVTTAVAVVNGNTLIPGNRYEITWGSQWSSRNYFEGTFSHEDTTHLKFLNVLWSGNTFSDYFIPKSDLLGVRDTTNLPVSTGKGSAVVTRTGARLEIGKEYYVTTNDGAPSFKGRFDNASGSQGTTSCVLIFDDVEFSSGMKQGNYQVLEEYIVTATERAILAPGLLPYPTSSSSPVPSSMVPNFKNYQAQINAVCSQIMERERAYIEFKKPKKSCSCNMRDLSMNGCTCGAYEAEMREKYGPEWKKPHWR